MPGKASFYLIHTAAEKQDSREIGICNVSSDYKLLEFYQMVDGCLGRLKMTYITKSNDRTFLVM